jgi:hypothetical protein
MLDTLLGLIIRYGTPRQRRAAQWIARALLKRYCWRCLVSYPIERLWAARRG